MTTLRYLMAASMIFAASTLSATASDKYAAIRSVAVISTVGHELNNETRGATAFGNSQEKVQIADWGIDDWAIQAVAKALSGRFETKHVSIDASALQNCKIEGDCATKLPHSDLVDAYVVIEPARSRGNGAEDLRGIGIFFSSVPFSGYKCVPHAIYSVTVIDARTGKRIDSGRGVLHGPYGDYPPISDVPGTKWPNTWQALTVEQQEQFKKTLMQLFMTSFSSALENAELPSAGIPPFQSDGLSRPN